MGSEMCIRDRNNGVPTTVLQAEDGQKTTFFNWDSEKLPSSRSPVALCNDVSAKLNGYAADESNDLSALTFKTDMIRGDIPTICATDTPLECESILFTLSPSHDADKVAINVLDDILDKDLQTNRVVSPARGLQSVTHSVNIWELILGRKLIKSF